MKCYPSMDLYGGRCVRLQQGLFKNQTVYSEDPQTILSHFYQAGCQTVHVVDLEGAQMGSPQQTQYIIDLAQQTPLRLQVGGGIRTRADVENYLSNGIARVVVGSLAVTHPEYLTDWLTEFGSERFVLACDIRYEQGIPYVATQGWQQQTQITLWTLLDTFSKHALLYLLCTDIACDGMLKGPNLALYRAIKKNFPHLNIQASGGIHTIENIHQLETLALEGCIVGKAIYEQHLQLTDLKPWF